MNTSKRMSCGLTKMLIVLSALLGGKAFFVRPHILGLPEFSGILEGDWFQMRPVVNNVARITGARR